VISGRIFTSLYGGLAVSHHEHTGQYKSVFLPTELSFYEPVTNLLLEVASLVLDHQGGNNGGPNQWIRVMITSRLLKIYLSLRVLK